MPHHDRLTPAQAALLAAGAAAVTVSASYFMYSRSSSEYTTTTEAKPAAVEAAESTTPVAVGSAAAVDTSMADAVDMQQISRMSVNGLAQYLHARGLPHPVICELTTHHVDGAVLVRLTEKDLLEMGIKSIGARMRLLDIIKAAAGAVAYKTTPTKHQHQQQQQQQTLVQPPWVEAQKHHPSPVRIHNEAQHNSASSSNVQHQHQQQQQAEEEQQQQQQQRNEQTRKVLGTLSAVFRALSDANFVRLDTRQQLEKITDAQYVLHQTEQHIATLPRAEAAQYRKSLDSFKELVSMLAQRLEALEAGRAQQRQQQQQSSQDPSVEPQQQQQQRATTDESISTAMARLESATVFVASQDFRKLAVEERTRILDQTSRIYDSLVNYCMDNPRVQEAVVPRLVRVQQVLSGVAEELTTSTATSPRPSTTAASVHANRASANPAAAAAAAAAPQLSQQQQEAASNSRSLVDMFGFFNSDEFGAMPNEEKLKMMDVAEARLASVIRSAQTLPREKRAAIAPTVEQLSAMLGQMRSRFTTTTTTARKPPVAQQQQQQQHHLPVRRSHPDDAVDFNGEPAAQPKPKQQQQQYEADDEEEEEEYDSEDEHGRNESDYQRYQEQGGNIRAALVLLRDMLETLTSTDFQHLPVKDRIHDVQVAQKLYVDIVDLLDQCEPEVVKAFATVVRQLGQAVETVKENLVQEIQDQQKAAQMQQQQQQKPSSRQQQQQQQQSVGERPRVAPRRRAQQQQQQQQQQAAQSQQQAKQQSAKDQEDLKMLFSTFQFMAGESFDGLPRDKKVTLLQRAKTQLEAQLARVERSPSQQEKEQLSPILQQFVDILMSVNQLVKEQDRAEAIQAQKQQLQQEYDDAEDEEEEQQQQDQADDDEEEDGSPNGDKNNNLQATLQQISTVLGIMLADEYTSMAPEQQQRLSAAGYRLVNIATEQLKTASPEEQQTFGPLLEKMTHALSTTNKANDKQQQARSQGQQQQQQQQQQRAPAPAPEYQPPQQQQQQQQGASTIDLAKPMALMQQAYELVTSPQMQQIGGEQKEGVLKRLEELIKLNIKLMQNASDEDRQRYGPILMAVVDGIKNPPPKPAATTNSAPPPSAAAPVPAPRKNTSSTSNNRNESPMAEPMELLQRSAKMMVSHHFQSEALDQEQRLGIMKKTQELVVMNLQLLQQASDEDKEYYAPILMAVVETIKSGKDTLPALQPLQEQKQSAAAAPAAAAAAAAPAAGGGSNDVDMSKPMEMLLTIFKMLVSPHFSNMPDEEKMNVINKAQELVILNVKLLERASPSDQQRYGSALSQVVQSFKKIGILTGDSVEKALADMQQQQQPSAAAAKPAAAQPQQQQQQQAEAPNMDVLNELVASMQQLTSPDFADMPHQQRSKILAGARQRLVTIKSMVMTGAFPPEAAARIGPLVKKFQELVEMVSKADTAIAAAQAEQGAAEEKQQQQQEQQSGGGGSIGSQAQAQADFDRLSKLFSQLTQSPAEFRSLDADTRRRVVESGLELIRRCAAHMKTAPEEEAQQMLPLLAQIRDFFNELEANLQRLEAAGANESKQERAHTEKRGEAQQALQQQREKAAAAASAKTDVEMLNELVACMQQLTAPGFLEMPHAERSKIIAGARQRLATTQDMMDKGAFPPQSAARIAPLVNKFSELVDAVSKADGAMLQAQAQEDATNNSSKKQQQPQQDAASGPAESVNALQQLMEVYQMILNPKFQTLPVETQRKTISTVRTLAQVVARGMATEKNVQLRQKVVNFLGKVGDVVEMLDGAVGRSSIGQQQQQQQQTQVDSDDEDEEAADPPPQPRPEDEDDSCSDEDEPVDGEAELAGQLDSLLEIIKAEGTMESIREGGPRREQVLTLISTAVDQCQRQINIIGERGQQYQPILNQIKQAHENIAGIFINPSAAPASKKQKGNGKSPQQQQQQQPKQQQQQAPSQAQQRMSSMEQAREVSTTLGAVLNALNSDKLLSLPDAERAQVLNQVSGTVSMLRRRTEELDEEARQTLLPTLQQIEEFIGAMSKMTSQASAAGVRADDVRRAQEQQQDDDEEEEEEEQEDDGERPSVDDSDLRQRLLGQLQKVDDVISSPGFQAAPLDVKRSTAQMIMEQMTELRSAAKKLLPARDVESFENDAADIVSRLTQMLQTDRTGSSQKSSSPQQQQQQQQRQQQQDSSSSSSDEEEEEQSAGNGGRPAGRAAPDDIGPAAKQILNKVQQFFGILNSPQFVNASEAARQKIAEEVLRQTKVLLHAAGRLPQAEQGEIRPILLGIIRMTRAVSDPEGEERDEETDDEDEAEQQQQQQQQRNSQDDQPAVAVGAAAAAPAAGSPASSSKKSNDASTESADLEQELKKSEKTNRGMQELLTVARLLQGEGPIDKEDVADIAERVETILREDLTMWREVPELKSLVRFITALLSKRTEVLETSFSGEFDGESDEEEEEEDDEEQQQNDDEQQQSNKSTRTPLEARLFQVTQQLIASADKIDSESKLEPFVKVLQAIGPHREGLNPTEAQLFQTLLKQVNLIMRGLSNRNSPKQEEEQQPSSSSPKSNGNGSKAASPASAASGSGSKAGSPAAASPGSASRRRNQGNGSSSSPASAQRETLSAGTSHRD